MELRLKSSEVASAATLFAPLANEKSLLVLDGVSQGLSLGQIASQFDLPRSTVHEYVTTLTGAGYLVRADHGYVATNLGLSVMSWLASTVVPRMLAYRTLLDVGRDLRNLRTVGESIHKLSIETEQQEFVHGLEILHELEHAWFQAMQTVSAIFEFVEQEG